uniref:NB-ARC domain-containing protein n=1 Tax=Triticum aestivum TaxID=4565 RepID=A0A3B6PIF0_WHEAT
MAELVVAANLAGSVASRNAPKLWDYLVQNRKLRAELKHDISYIRSESLMISAAIQQDGDRPPWSSNPVHKVWITMVRDLAYDIEDCIDRFTHRVTLKPDVSWIVKKFHRMKTRSARNKFAAAIRRLRKKSEDASKLRTSYSTSEYGGGSSTLESETPSDDTDTSVAAVGMDVPHDELMELIRETPQGQQPMELKVISLVGFGGIGKTLLTKHVYNTTESEYKARAWVCAAEKGSRDVLKEILWQLGMHSTISSSSGSAGNPCRLSNNMLCASLRECLGTKRFLIVIDDMRRDFWVDIKDAFPVVPGVNSRVIVTTATQTIAIKSSCRDGHVYIMRTLAEQHSKQLFFEKASLVYPPTVRDTELSSEVIRKCDGLPLALITTARLLHGDHRRRQWADLGNNLGSHLETHHMLANMKRVLVRSYTNLSKQDIKICLLYLGIYPSGRPIRRGSLIRRWSAEGFITAEPKRSALEVAVASFNELVDKSIIQPIDASGNGSAEVKTCKPHSIMLEFILHRSMSENFVTLLYDKDPPPGSKIRWISLQHKTDARSKMDPKDLSLVRSLTIFGEAHNSMLDFSKYKLIRVLDLEECDEHLGDKHLKEICSNMSLLRYLSLRGATRVTVIPKQIKKLQLLETLDLRGTSIEILTIEVMELPYLIHLFGKFKLQQDVGSRRMSKLQTWLSERSKLETLAGFVVDNNSQGFTQIMEHMKHLTKVKIWCEFTAHDSSNSRHLSKSIKGFIQSGTDLNKAHSLSLNTNDEWCPDLLDFSLEKDYSYYLSSLKLQGNTICSQLPLFVTMLGGLTKLCLSFLGDHKLSGNILDALSRVRGLEYLKLIATQLDKLGIRQGHALRSLRHLCVVAEVATELEIQEGALPRLEFLRLLLSDETKQEWKGAKKNHPRRPKLLFVETKPMGSESAAEIIPAETTTDTTVEEVDVEREPAAAATDTTLSVTTLPNVTTKETGVTSGMVDDQELMKSEPAAEASPAAIATDTTADEVDVKSAPAENFESPVPSPTDAISTVQVDGGQHDDEQGKYFANTKDVKYFAKKHGLSVQVTDRMNKGSSKEEMEGMAGLEGQQMEDATKNQGLRNKQRLRTRLSSLVAIGVFRQRSRQGMLVP